MNLYDNVIDIVCTGGDFESFAKLLKDERDVESFIDSLSPLLFPGDLATKIYHYLKQMDLSEAMIDKLNEKKRLGEASFNLLEACRSGDLNTVQDIILQGMDFHKHDTVFFSSSILNDQLEIAEFLLQNGAAHFATADPQVDRRAFEILHEYIDGYFDVQLDFDLHEERLESVGKIKQVIEFLLKHGFNLNHIRVYSFPGTPLDAALYWERAGTYELKPVIEFLQQKGAKTRAEIESAEPAPLPELSNKAIPGKDPPAG